MSSLFNYELDENNIRSTLLKSGNSEFNESEWNDFENNYLLHHTKPVSRNFIKLPEIHLNINRNIILPLFFILALVGVSAIMLSFIDFKSDKEQVEKKLQPNADNYHPKVAKSAIKPNEKSIQETKQKAAVNSQAVSANTVAVTDASLTNSSVIVTNNDPVIPSVNTVTSTTSALKTTEIFNTPASLASSASSVQPIQHKIRRKHTEKVPSEQIETIKAPALIKNESETAETEPDLEIKID